MIQAEELISTNISYETLLEAELGITVGDIDHRVLSVSNKYGLCFFVKGTSLIVLSVADLESNSSCASPVAAIEKTCHEVAFNETVHGMYLSPEETSLCVVLATRVVVTKVAQLMQKVV